MLRCLLALALVSLASAQQQPPAGQSQPKKLESQRPKPATSPQEEIPPEEDKDLSRQEYSFNPLQSQKDVAVGNQYFKNHKFRAAELRYTSATRWNDGNADAWLHLGEVEERLKDADKAKAAYEKYVELASDQKKAAEIKKKLEKLK
jgi:tetratricopeptide (TPR) repeat protein